MGTMTWLAHPDPDIQRADLVKQLEYAIGAYRRGVHCRRLDHWLRADRPR